ncbi:MAG TPA: hypothetical protein DCZ01_12015 [Elusimicrobia bacterium]|nr:MAG: hypothetical protein A2X37_01030 [Elusimicrobia bacterium GWA2_66_18]OGR70471.1 MAG: hypothetical protein A2X40_09320 [Elusimicrobia bacterium GWC2_65_9]HAZ09216.1 hypothetical protein [Elusimicrobiota bacterium]
MNFRRSGDEDEGGLSLRGGLLVGAAAVAMIGAWIWLAHPGDETISSQGFNMGIGGPAPARPRDLPAGAAPALTPRESGDVLAMIRREPLPGNIEHSPSGPSVDPGFLTKTTPPAAAGAATPPSAPRSAPPEADRHALAAAGIPTDAKGLSNLGAQKGLLSAVTAKLLDHPAILKAVFNNKLVVDAFMSRDVSLRNCSDSGALKSYLSDPNSAGMTKVFPVLQAALSNPASAAALAGTEMAKRVTECPSVRAMAKDPSAFMAVAVSNPKALQLLADPRLAQSLAAHSEASSLLSGVTASMGGAAPQR